ncbi:MAG: polyphosphate kinase 1 [Oscillospiraceae bacterium]|nr:polyphosphate kinase 1 [Oscillospiraceae bacterium]
MVTNVKTGETTGEITKEITCMQNRELSWLKFNERVLEEAAAPSVPLLERLKFLSIFTTNLDEFFMVRVGALTDHRMFFPQDRDTKTQMTAEEQIRAIMAATAPLYARRDVLFAELGEELSRAGVEYCVLSSLTSAEIGKLEKRFMRDILPLLSPQVIDLQHPFPHMLSNKMYIAALLSKGHANVYGLTLVPDNMDRIIPLAGTGLRFVLLEDLIEHFTNLVFHTYDPVETAVLKVVQSKDILLSYPYESISPFLSLVREAAQSSAVLSIKITLYRIDMQSRLADALILAAENGKDVVVLMELRARFDEENNIEWARRLEEAGCRVMYGFPGYKVHSKICHITKREFGHVSYITQIGTGNYNEKTAALYTDLSLITADREIGEDAANFFSNLLLGNLEGSYRHLLVAPKGLKSALIALMEEQTRIAASGGSGRMILKCNSLTDREIIECLVRASQAGVKISMIVQGICCITPGVPGQTDNITITSIVGRFLEHNRIYVFGMGDSRKIYISSADLMTRNMERRVEIACPIRDRQLAERISNMLELMLMDNVKAREQNAQGIYIQKTPPIDLCINSQKMLCDEARQNGAARATQERRIDLIKEIKNVFSAWLRHIRHP